VIYLDSCALVKLVVTEPETPALQRYLDGRRSEMVSCELALTEVLRSVRRARYDRQQGRQVDESVLAARVEAGAALLDSIDLIVVNTSTFIQAGAFATDPDVGSLDAIHLVSARRIGSALEAFVTYDGALARAATACGLPVAQPA
jgi:predicted nucleic acid-binding protein